MTSPRHASRTDRFHNSYEKRGTCWIWTKKIGRDGYGRFYLGRRWLMAHRFAWELLIGPIPEGLEPDHLCHTRDLSCPGGPTCIHRRCVNPDHLEAVTHRENMRRTPYIAAKVAQVECINGHSYDDHNTRIDTRGCRRCRTCHAIEERARKATARAARKAAS